MSSSGGSFQISRRRSVVLHPQSGRCQTAGRTDTGQAERWERKAGGTLERRIPLGRKKKRLVAQPLLGWMIWCAVCYLFSTTMFCAIENTPGTPCALMLAMFLSISLAAIPSKVTCPFFTIM
jgi:hypothetical protein